MDKDNFFMLEAIKQAKKAYEENEVPVGCVIVFEDKIIARGYNQVEKLKDPTAHAEILCITSAAAHFNDWRLLDTTMYTTLEPCTMCAGAILNARINRLVYSAPDIRVGANGSFIDVFKDHPIHSLEITKDVLKEITSDLLKSFFQKKRKVKKA